MLVEQTYIISLTVGSAYISTDMNLQKWNPVIFLFKSFLSLLWHENQVSDNLSIFFFFLKRT